MPHRVMNVKEIASYLHLAPARVEELIKQRDIPFQKQGDRFVFRRAEIDAWGKGDPALHEKPLGRIIA